MLGVVPELSYSDGLSVTDVVIKFNLDNSAVTGGMGVFDEDLQGVNRYNVFKYFEDTNMFLPVETAYDEETNTVSAHVDEVGTYCLIDMEKWLSSLENMPSGNYYEGGDNEPANIVFCLDTGNISDNESFEAAKADIKLITEDAFNRYSDIKVYLYYQQFGSNFKASNQLLTDTDGNNYFTGYEEAEAALDKLETYMIKSSFRAYDFVEATQFMIDKIDTCDQNIIAMYHITADERVMGSINAAKKLTQTVRNSKYTTADEEEMQRIHVSTICPNSDKPFNTDSYAYELAELSGGIAVTGYDNAETELQTAEVEAAEVPANSAESKTYTSVKNNLTEILGEGNNGTYKIISSTGLTAIKLKAQLKAASKTDTDEDGIYDWDEVCIEAIEELKENKISDGKIKSGDLPSLLQVMSYYNKNKKGYVCGGFEKYMNANGGNPFSALNCTFILPINSDPTEVDSDGDGITDGSMLIGNAKYTDDEKPLKYSYKYYDEELYTIHLKYPKAEFNFSEINMAASEFIQLQYDTNSSMTEIKIDNPYIETDRARISKLENQGIKCDYNFYYANYNGIMNYVEPSTYLDERHIMAFLDMKDKNKSACMNQARNMLINTYFDQPGEIDNYAKYFVEAANENEMSVSYLISKVIIESAAGSKGSCSRLCAGNNYKGNMIYNMYVIGATDGDAVNQGMKTAYENGWTTEELAIKGGARWINEHYILVGQDTLYKQRYNIIGCVNNGFISHQYATDIAMAYSKAEVMYNKSFSIVKYEKIFFEIPIYSDYKTSN